MISKREKAERSKRKYQELLKFKAFKNWMTMGGRLYSRDSELMGIITGSRKQCQLEGCKGLRIGVRWPDGKITWPCSEGLGPYKDGVKIK